LVIVHFNARVYHGCIARGDQKGVNNRSGNSRKEGTRSVEIGGAKETVVWQKKWALPFYLGWA
jgi:hypothetical protein